MDHDQRKLSEELAIYMGHWMAGGPARQGRSKPVYHSHQTPFSDCCRALWDLGVAFPTDATGKELDKSEGAAGRAGTLPAYFTFLDERESRARLATLAPDKFNSQYLLSIFADSLGFSDQRLRLTTEVFPSERLPGPLGNALVDAGLAERSGGGFRWTNLLELS